MTRILGINISEKKHVVIGLKSIFGIGLSSSKKICDLLGIPLEKKVGMLSNLEINSLRKELKKFKLEGDLKREIQFSIKRLIDIKNYRGIRHKKKLPVRGQRTRTNAKTGKKKIKK